MAARQWLDKMSRSLRGKSYSGIFTYEHGAQMQSLSIDHQVINGVEQEELVYLDGEARRVVRKDHPLNCIHPGHRLVRFNDQVGRDQDCGLSAFYRFSVSSGERVAGRDAVQLRVIPRDMYRYGYQFAVDKKSALLLKSQLMGEKGQVLERFQFSKMSVGDEVEEPVIARGSAYLAHHSQIEHQTEAVDAGSWLVTWVPSGFMLASMPISNTLDARTYTDGLAVFSVIVEPMGRVGSDSNEDGEGRAHQGATMAYTRAIKVGSNSYMVTVIGEVPLDTAKRVASSVNLRS